MSYPTTTSTYPAKPRNTAVPATQVELRIACRDVLDMDVTSKSDPMCVVFCKDPYNREQYYEVGRTEVIKNTVNPDFVKSIPMSYSFEEQQKLRFDVYDSDYSGVSSLSKHDYLGRMECTLGEIVSNQGTQYKKPLTSRYGSHGIILVTAEEVGSCKEILVMQWSASSLDKKDVFGKSDPFLTFSKINDDRSQTVVHKTEVIKNTLNPVWRPMKIPMRVLCGGDMDRAIVVKCYDWDSDGGHDLIGEFQTHVKTLVKGKGADNLYECINPKKKAKKSSYKNSGTVRLASCKVEIEYSFLDYIQKGTQLHFTVAVDFTASNGDPRDRSSLHYQNPSTPNPYVVAIRSVGEIISDYDSDKMFPALGFGAKVPPEWQVSHEFFLNGNPTNPYCAGVDGILAAYTQTLHSVQLYGPTNFAPIINHVARFATAVRDGSAYFVLLIITDGAISDMNNTKRAIVNASTLPMSIIIVGVGNADFAAMEELDGDSLGLSADGRYAQRDVVQFVALNNFLQPNVPWHHTQARLAKEVLAEIPRQLVAYMTKNSIIPRAGIVQSGGPSAPPVAQAPPTTQGFPGARPTTQGHPGAPPTTQGYPGAPPTSQGHPGAPQTAGYPSLPPTIQGYPGAPPTTQGYPGAPPTTQGYPGAPPTTQGYPGAPPTTQGYPGAPPTTQGYPGAPPTTQGYPGAPPTTQGYPGAPPTTQGYPSAPPTTQGYPGAPPTTQGYPGAPPTAPGYPGAPPTTYGAGYPPPGAPPSSAPPFISR